MNSRSPATAKRGLRLWLAVALLCGTHAAANGFSGVRTLWATARTTSAQDARASLPAYESAIRSSPGNSWLMRSAISAALNASDLERSRRWLGLYASQGGTLTPENLNVLSGRLGEVGLVGRLLANRTAIERSSVWMTLPAWIPLVEGIAYDELTQTTYVSSVATSAIYQLIPGQAPRPIALPPDVGGPMGIAIDRVRRVLWVALDSAAPRIGPGAGRSGLLRLELSTQAGQFIAGPAGDDIHLGDVTVARDGTVFAADNHDGAIYLCRTGCNVLETLVPPGALQSAQGMALSADEARLYVADYGYGIAVYDRSTHRLDQLRTNAGIALDRIDGLVRVGDKLVAVQTGWDPPRLIQIGLDARGTTALSATVLERGHRLAREPTQIALVGNGSLAYVANSQWEIYGSGGVREGRTQGETYILRLPVGPRSGREAAQDD